MSCGRHHDDSPAREAERAATTAANNKIAIEKISNYFIEIAGTSNVLVSRDSQYFDPTRVVLTIGEGLLLQHRGYKISITTPKPKELEAQFREWCRKELTHVRIRTL